MANLQLHNFFPKSFLNESSLHKTLGEDFPLCESGNVVFHWADFHETCDTILKNIETDSFLADDFKGRESGINRLNNIPVWVRTQSKVHQSTMHDLYQRFIFNQNELLGGVDPFGPIEISFISGTGPFKEMAIAECFNKDTYRDFILVNLLKGKLPKRDFRVRLKVKVLVEYGENFEKANLIQVEQLTTNGMLLSMDSDLFTREITVAPKMRVLIDTTAFSEAEGMNLSDLKDHLGKYAFNLMYSSKKEDAFECNLSKFSLQSSFDFLKNKKVFLFVSYKNLVSSDDQKRDRILGFVNQTKELVREHYLSLDKKRSA